MNTRIAVPRRTKKRRDLFQKVFFFVHKIHAVTGIAKKERAAVLAAIEMPNKNPLFMYFFRDDCFKFKEERRIRITKNVKKLSVTAKWAVCIKDGEKAINTLAIVPTFLENIFFPAI